MVQNLGSIQPFHIRLSNKSFDADAAVVVRDFLLSLEGVTNADISDIIAGRPTEEALQTLCLICDGLKHFPLEEFNVSDNALGPRGVESCKEVLVKNTLKVCSCKPRCIYFWYNFI